MMCRFYFFLLFIFFARAESDCLAQTKETLFHRRDQALAAELRRMLQIDQQFRADGRIAEEHAARIHRIDSANTCRMIEIIRTYGFPSMERVRRLDNDLAPHIILMHAPAMYFDTIRALLNAEREAGRITVFEYEQIMWHLNGRTGHPR
jgi:hypothetical protein